MNDGWKDFEAEGLTNADLARALGKWFRESEYPWQSDEVIMFSEDKKSVHSSVGTVAAYIAMLVTKHYNLRFSKIQFEDFKRSMWELYQWLAMCNRYAGRAKFSPITRRDTDVELTQEECDNKLNNKQAVVTQLILIGLGQQQNPLPIPDLDVSIYD